MGGYVGKIARIDLTTKAISHISTSDYEFWGGGHGIGSAMFYDIMVKEKGLNLEEIDGFHPENLVTVMTSPLTATGIPSATGRIEIQGVSAPCSNLRGMTAWRSRVRHPNRCGSISGTTRLRYGRAASLTSGEWIRLKPRKKSGIM